MITGKTRLIGHMGYPTEAFKAPMIYNPWFDAKGVDAVVVPFGIKPEDFTRTPVQITTGISGSFDPALYKVDGMSPILAIGHHSLARTDSGLFAWGNNNYGQLGFTPGTPTYSATPTKVSGF